MLVDFHSHTFKSDGTSSPAQIAAMMLERGVEIYAITDHDTLAAYPELPLDAKGPKLVVGIEINTTFRGDDVHILGYRSRQKILRSTRPSHIISVRAQSVCKQWWSAYAPPA